MNGYVRPPPLAGVDETRRLAFATSVGAVRCSRAFSLEALRAWHWSGTYDSGTAAGEERRAVVEDVLLMVSELVTNACLYAPGGPRELRLSWDGIRLRVEVVDDSPLPPRPRPFAEPGRPGGHGLRVVDRLARAWGSVPEGRGKAVWLEVSPPLDGHVYRGRY
ncbi:ATP-binding protein [Kitasatospora sp. NPDC048538]|uniref:ATP-binding protein n=1 Tax=unclassified Kitasatospora TaxID=2633591 RepID=UPI0033C926FE